MPTNSIQYSLMKKPVLYLTYAAFLLVLLYISKVGTFVMSLLNAIISPIHNRGLILCTIAAILILTIEILREHYPIPNPKRRKRPITMTPLCSDQPTSDDKYGRHTSANLLIEKIFSTFNAAQADKGSYVININESYGYGKTSFLQILNKQLEAQSQPYYIIDFRPWLCDNDQAIIKEFFSLLSIKLKDYSLNDEINRYLVLLLEESSQLSPWWTKITLSLFSKAIKPYTLKETHDKIRTTLTSIDRPIIITIDDIDRLEKEELTAVLKLIRDTADFPNIFYIVAAENAHLEAMLSQIGIQNPNIYLKKFFNLDFLLPANENIHIYHFLSTFKQALLNYGYSKEAITSALLRYHDLDRLSYAFHNLREVNRLMNAYSTTLDLLRHHNNIHQVDPFEQLCIIMIRHLWPDIYKTLRDHNYQLLKLTPYQNDSYLVLKDRVNLEKKLKQKEAEEHFARMHEDKEKLAELKKEEEDPEDMDFSEMIAKTQVTPAMIVSQLLDYLFGEITHKTTKSVCRSNYYFLYFSGKMESDKISPAEGVSILKMEIKDYEAKLDKLFKSGKNEAFFNEFSHSYHKSGINKIDALKKFYTLLKYQYKYNSRVNKDLNSTFEDYINYFNESFAFFLVHLFGSNQIERENSLKSTKDLMEHFCNEENDLNMLTLSFYIFSVRYEVFCFDRGFIIKMMQIIADRVLNEHLILHDFPTAEEDYLFDTIRLLREETSTNSSWIEKFIKFLEFDENRCRRWLGSVATIYSNGEVEWNRRRHEAIVGHYSNSGDVLFNRLQKKFPDCAKAIEELSHLQRESSLQHIHFKNSKFYDWIWDRR